MSFMMLKQIVQQNWLLLLGNIFLSPPLKIIIILTHTDIIFSGTVTVDLGLLLLHRGAHLSTVVMS